MLELILGGLLAYNLFFSDDDDSASGTNTNSLGVGPTALGLFNNYKGADADAVLTKLTTVAAGIPIDPNALIGIIYEESRFDPGVINKVGPGAVGLLQFTPDVLTKLGVTQNDVANMSALDQLDYISTYFSWYNINSPYDLWFAVFWPSAIGQPDTYVLQTPTLSASLVAKDNPGIAKGKDQITVADAKAYIAPFISDT